MLSYTPEVARGYFQLGKTNFRHVKSRNRQLAIMALISILDIPYMAYCHYRLSQAVGFTDQQCKDALAGKLPQGLSDAEISVYGLGKVFTTLAKPLNDATWQEFASKIDKPEIIGITHIIGGYKSVAPWSFWGT